ncbi:MAG: hypothetical protein CMA85_01785 [Euryarchaeota archaeon]|nr:hypothetical protein [Euryarchaeota archaeon]
MIRISGQVPPRIVKRAKDSSLPVTVRVGKEGITEQVVVELREQLSKRGLVKVKANRGMLANSVERAACFNRLAAESDAILAHSIGNVAVFWNSR